MMKFEKRNNTSYKLKLKEETQGTGNLKRLLDWEEVYY